MSRTWSALLLACALLSGCRNSDRSKEKVQAAIEERLRSQTGLDLNTLDVTTTSVSFDKNLAYATVAFHPKNDPRVDSSMLMKYTLQDRDGKWVVIKVGDGQGHSMGHGFGQGQGMGQGLPPATPGGTVLPPGHPPVGNSPHSATSKSQ